MQNTGGRSILQRFYTSSLGKKLITGVTGLGLALFILLHMVGNLVLFISRDAYNAYAFYLEQLGPVFWTIELALLLVIALHASTGIRLWLNRRQARPTGYLTYASKGAPSLQSLSSRTMIVTGGVLGIFLVIHLLNFKFGTWYVTAWEGREIRDLARLVVEKFQHPVYVIGYSGVLILLGFHLRHGLWSALQSLGLMARSLRLTLYGLSLGLAIALVMGFIILPLAIYGGFVS